MFQFGQSVRIETKTKTYTLSRLEYEMELHFRDWIEEREDLGGRFEDLKKQWDFLDAEQRRKWTDEAKQIKEDLRAFSIGSELAKKYMSTALGMTELLFLLLQKHHPDVTRGEAYQVLQEVSIQEANKAINKTAGSPPPSEKNELAPAA